MNFRGGGGDNTTKFGRLIKNRCFDQKGYSLEKQINPNSKIMALID